MLAEIAAAIKPNEETVALAGHTLVVRELNTAAVLGGGADDEDIFYRAMVRCVFDEAGAPALTEDDIPALKAASKSKLLPLITAVKRVNGLLEEANTGKSEPGPG